MCVEIHLLHLGQSWKVCTLWYRPIELLLGVTHYGPSLDVWSAGREVVWKPLKTGDDRWHLDKSARTEDFSQTRWAVYRCKIEMRQHESLLSFSCFPLILYFESHSWSSYYITWPENNLAISFSAQMFHAQVAPINFTLASSMVNRMCHGRDGNTSRIVRWWLWNWHHLQEWNLRPVCCLGWYPPCDSEGKNILVFEGL